MPIITGPASIPAEFCNSAADVAIAARIQKARDAAAAGRGYLVELTPEQVRRRMERMEKDRAEAQAESQRDDRDWDRPYRSRYED